jgi:hypothetical protein
VRVDHENQTIMCDRCGKRAPSHGDITLSVLHAEFSHGWVNWVPPNQEPPDSQTLSLCPTCKTEFTDTSTWVTAKDIESYLNDEWPSKWSVGPDMTDWPTGNEEGE